MVKIIGIILLVVGVVLWCGNVFGFLPTFPGAGYIGLVLGGIVFKAGSNSED
jgi:hypothetical protein